MRRTVASHDGVRARPRRLARRLGVGAARAAPGGAGHTAVAPDLPCEDPEADTPDYARVVLDALPDDGDVVLVAHSLGALTAPLVARQRPVGTSSCSPRCPRPGAACRPAARRTGHPAAPDERGDRARRAQRRAGTTPSPPPARCTRDSHPLIAAGAFARLRPQAAAPQVSPSPLERWPDVPTDYVVCTGDRMVSPSWGARRGRELGATVRELATDHSPMLSRPDELAALLLSYSSTA